MTLEWLPDYVAVDIETSGLAAQEDDLLEIAGVKFVAGEPVDRFTTTLQTGKVLGQRTARMTGLTDLALAAGLPAQEALRSLDAFAGSLPLVAHNVSLDREFLIRFSHELEGVDFTDNPWWDSLELAALVFPELDSLALEHVAIALGIEIGTLHRAEADAELAGRVFAQLFGHIAQTWPAHLVATLRTGDLADHAFGTILQSLELGEIAEPEPLRFAPPVPIELAQFAPRTGSTPEAVPLTVVRVNTEAEALSHWQQALGAETRGRMIAPPLTYPGGFHGPEKDLHASCEVLGIPLYPGRQCLVHPLKLSALFAGALAIPGQLGAFERALLRAWTTTTESADATHLSWWVLNNYPTLAAAFKSLNAAEAGSLPVSDPRLSSLEHAQRDCHMGCVPWDVPLAVQHPLTSDATLGATLLDTVTDWAILKGPYWPLHALRALRIALPFSAMHQELTWLGELLEFAPPPDCAPLREWWDAEGAALRDLLHETVKTLAIYGENPQHPLCTIRGDESYWPLVDDPDAGLDDTAVSLALRKLDTSCATAVPGALAAAGSMETTDLALGHARVVLAHLEFLRAALHWMRLSPGMLTKVVVRRQVGKEIWWSLDCFPPVPQSLAAALPGCKRLQVYSTYLDSEDWHLAARLWGTTSAPATFVDAADPIPAGNTVHLPLMPPGVRTLPAKKVWQNWQLGILRRLIQQGEGRWLIVARNPQDVATLQYRLRDGMQKAGWQPLFQRHDGTKGFLMREFGGFEKVVMVGTGEILQELDRFPTPPDTLVILHVPTRPPNDLACLAIQQQRNLSADLFRESVIAPLGVLDLKRAFHQWAPFRHGTSSVYLLDFRQLDQTELRGLLNQSFPNQELLDTQQGSRY